MDQESRSRLVEAFDKAKWVGFDLDDTLHEFRLASGEATEEVLSIINSSYTTETRVEDLRAAYKSILRAGTSSAFVDGKTSHEYRRQRFTALLTQSGLQTEDSFVDSLLSAYEDRLSKSLVLKDGVEELLTFLKRKGKKIMVVTEGPQDAQERTVKQLLDAKIDALSTTNEFGVAKVDGLFTRVLDLFGIRPDEMVYIGDSLDRDIVPALEAGMFAVHLDEKRSLTQTEASYTISAFRQLKEILGTTDV